MPPNHKNQLTYREEWKMSSVSEVYISTHARDFKSCSIWMQKVKASRKGIEELHAIILNIKGHEGEVMDFRSRWSSGKRWGNFCFVRMGGELRQILQGNQRFWKKSWNCGRWLCLIGRWNIQHTWAEVFSVFQRWGRERRRNKGTKKCGTVRFLLEKEVCKKK